MRCRKSSSFLLAAASLLAVFLSALAFPVHLTAQESSPLSKQSPDKSLTQSQPGPSVTQSLDELQHLLLTLKNNLQSRQVRADEQASSSKTTGTELDKSSQEVQNSLDSSASASEQTSTSLTDASASLINSEKASKASDSAEDKLVESQVSLVKELESQRWGYAVLGAVCGAVSVALAWLFYSVLH